MNFANYKKRLLAVSAALVLGLGAIFALPGLSEASYGRISNYNWGNCNSCGHNYFGRNILGSRSFYRHGYVNRFSFYDRGIYRNNFYPRNIVLYDRDNYTNRIFLQNRLTGPYSYNANNVYLGVRSDYFNRVYRDFDYNSNIGIDVDTGHNTVSFNTVAGDLDTGDVSISISD